MTLALVMISTSTKYSRRPTAQQLYPAYVKARTRKRILKRVLLGALCVLVACVVAAGAYGAWFSAQLNANMALDEGAAQEVNDALTSVDANQPFYVLLLGSDQRENSELSAGTQYADGSERSDVIMLARVDAAQRKVTLVSIPRDTPYTMQDGSVAKINETFRTGGAAATIAAVSEITGVPIAHYAEVHISNLEAVVDYLGGVDVYVDIDMTVKDVLTGEKVKLKQGQQTLNGQQAQAFARGRKMYDTDQDAHRQSNVRQLLEAILNKALSRPAYEIPSTILELSKSVSTDITSSDLLFLGTKYAGASGKMTMYSCTGPTDGSNWGADGIWLCYENPEGWAKLMAVVDSGEDPSGIDVSDTEIIPESSE